MADVFLSYSRHDEDIAERIKDALETDVAGQPLSVWQDTDLQPGTDWRDAVDKALHEANLLVVLLSDAALKSPSVVHKINYFVARNKLVIPVLLDKEVEIPSNLRDINCVDATTRDNQAIQKVAEYTKRVYHHPGDYETLPVRHEVTITFDVAPDTDLSEIIARISRLKGTTNVEIREKNVLTHERIDSESQSIL